MHKALFVLGLMLCGAVLAACDDSGSPTPGTATSTAGAGAKATRPPPATSVASPAPSATAAPTVTPASDPLTGFSFPLSGGCLPKGDQLMPNSPRPYRNGIHEGVDFYEVDNCTRIGLGTEVAAAKPGRVVRADVAFVEMTLQELAANLANPNTDAALDRFRGRQVWVQHEGGIITRYAHMSGVAPGIAVGSAVLGGQIVGYVGESGTPSSITNPGNEYHLHFEVRVGEGYLGKGLPPAEVRRLYQSLFAPQP